MVVGQRPISGWMKFRGTLWMEFTAGWERCVAWQPCIVCQVLSGVQNHMPDPVPLVGPELER